ncbi:hypothetical protein M3Y97_00513900 [Aphelenchoides bicaudatus]|nr:hypothetical protein M3Y97_00513900 [Aphelenchoides bicaudatus]
MIGMMNNTGNGTDMPEFYASPKRSSLYQQHKVRRETLSYTNDGRVLLDGTLKFQQSPDEMWQDLLLRMVCNTVRRDLQRTRTKSRMRRLMEQFSIQSNDPPVIQTAEEKDIIMHGSSITPQSSPATSYSSTASSSSAPYVTTIEIK